MDLDILKEKLKMLCEIIPENQWRYFNKRTIENYINNLEFIKVQIDKETARLILEDCLNDVDLNFDPSVDYSVYLYNQYLKHIKDHYRNLGFALVPGIRVFWLILIIISIVAFVLKTYLYLDMIFLSVAVAIFIRMLIKLKQNKTYGVGY